MLQRWIYKVVFDFRSNYKLALAVLGRFPANFRWIAERKVRTEGFDGHFTERERETGIRRTILHNEMGIHKITNSLNDEGEEKRTAKKENRCEIFCRYNIWSRLLM